MDKFGNFAEQPLKVGRGREVGSLRCFSVGVVMRLARLPAGFLGLCLGDGRRIKPGLQLRKSRLPFVQFTIERADLAEVATFKSGELATKIDELQLALCERRTNGSQLLAFAENFLFFGFQPPGDLT